MWIFYLIGFNAIISLGISIYWLYKSFKCSKIVSYSCKNEKCLLKQSCCGYKLSSNEEKRILELLERMEEETDY